MPSLKYKRQKLHCFTTFQGWVSKICRISSQCVKKLIWKLKKKKKHTVANCLKIEKYCALCSLWTLEHLERRLFQKLLVAEKLLLNQAEKEAPNAHSTLKAIKGYCVFSVHSCIAFFKSQGNLRTQAIQFFKPRFSLLIFASDSTCLGHLALIY